MINYNNELTRINNQEISNIAYCKVGEHSENLIVCFASNAHDGFERKKSLLDLKYNKKYNIDILYLRNRRKWYLGGLPGIGKNIIHTKSFLKNIFRNYNKVVCTGGSAGGYASLLFGSLLQVDSVVAMDAQTDLNYLIDKLSPKNHQMMDFQKRKKECPVSWNKFSKIKNVINDQVNYYVYFNGGNDVLHGLHHYDRIKDFSSVNRIDQNDAVVQITNILDLQ